MYHRSHSRQSWDGIQLHSGTHTPLGSWYSPGCSSCSLHIHPGLRSTNIQGVNILNHWHSVLNIWTQVHPLIYNKIGLVQQSRRCQRGSAWLCASVQSRWAGELGDSRDSSADQYLQLTFVFVYGPEQSNTLANPYRDSQGSWKVKPRNTGRKLGEINASKLSAGGIRLHFLSLLGLGVQLPKWVMDVSWVFRLHFPFAFSYLKKVGMLRPWTETQFPSFLDPSLNFFPFSLCVSV